MAYLTYSSNLSLWHLTPSQYEQLTDRKIRTFGDLFSKPIAEWERLFTKGLIHKIQHKMNQMHWDGQGVYLAYGNVLKIKEKQGRLLLLYAEGDQKCRIFLSHDDITLLAPVLSSRALRTLHNNGIETIGQIIDAPLDFLLRGAGEKTREELSVMVPVIQDSLSEGAEKTAAFCCQDQDLIHAISDMIDIDQAELRRIVLFVCMEESSTPIMERLYHMGFIQDKSKEKILSILHDYPGDISIKKIRNQMPSMMTDALFQQCLHQLELEGMLSIHENMLSKRCPPVLNYAASLSDPVARGVVLDRLHGMTLAEAGKKYGVTRERIRQIWQKNIDRAPLLAEDKYSYIWENYQFGSPEDFKQAFHESDVTVNYLDARYKMHRSKAIKDISEILSDELVPEELRKKAKKAIYKNYLAIGPIHVRKSRTHLIRYVIKRYCQKPTSFDDFIELYHNFLKDWGLDQDPLFILKNRSGERDRIASYDYLLWNHNKKFRYYDMSGEGFSELLETLNLESCENVDFSTLKMFRDHRDLMKKYDIRDEFELHNLLKKLWEKYRLNDHKDEDHQVFFARMPTIVVGHPDRYRQVMDILESRGTISAKDLCQAYEDAYGVRSHSVSANYLPHFYKYFHNGIYSVKWVHMEPAVQKKLKQLLDQDFYLFSDIKKLFQLHFPNENQDSLNYHTLKEIGFLVYNHYAVRGTYGSASNYFRHLLTCHEITDLREARSQYLYLPTFYQVLMALKQKRQITESEPWVYIRKDYLENHGWNQKRIDEFTENLASAIPEGTFFTMKSLQESGLWKPDPNPRLGRWFASSLLTMDTKHFSYIRLASARLMYRGVRQIRIIDFYRWLATEKHITDMHALASVMKNYYHVSFNKDIAKELIHNEDDLNTLFYMQSNA